MKSETPKVLFPICGEPMAATPLRALGDLCSSIIVVVGYEAERVEAELKAAFAREFGESLAKSKLHFVLQKEQRGTGDAVRVAVDLLAALKGKKSVPEAESVVVLNGDLPLVRAQIVQKLVNELESRKLDSLCLSSVVVDPQGLGRIIRDPRGVLERICEESDASEDFKKIKEVNSGVYAFRYKFLKSGLDTLNSDNKQKEFYLTDLLGIAKAPRRSTDALIIQGEDVEDLMGANSTWELARADSVAQSRWKRAICESFGVLFTAPESTYIERSVRFVGPAKVGLGVYLGGSTEVGRGVEIEGHSKILNTKLCDQASIKWGSVLSESYVGSRSSIGPMAHLRPETELKEDVKVGNFVELKKTTMQRGSKASHLTYLGDAEIGEESNIGCGTITCNYDGVNKHKTLIGKNVFIGSDSQLVAPVEIGDGAYIASGTTVTDDVPADALAIARPKLEIKKDYALRRSAAKTPNKK
jgi:bifunctional UDP-N-acetylglucosamine pyrophosphorylase / glucosamine-1-phosphate N-acetyltransferase